MEKEVWVIFFSSFEVHRVGFMAIKISHHMENRVIKIVSVIFKKLSYMTKIL